MKTIAIPFHRLGHSGMLFSMLHPRLIAIGDKVAAMGYAFAVTTSYRDPATQLAAFKSGHSKAKPGHSAHNFIPARALDFVPHPFTAWNDIPAFRNGAHVFLAAAHILGDAVIWGGDWNNNGSEADEHGLRDFGHIELADWRRL